MDLENLLTSQFSEAVNLWESVAFLGNLECATILYDEMIGLYKSDKQIKILTKAGREISSGRGKKCITYCMCFGTLGCVRIYS